MVAKRTDAKADVPTAKPLASSWMDDDLSSMADAKGSGGGGPLPHQPPPVSRHSGHAGTETMFAGAAAAAEAKDTAVITRQSSSDRSGPPFDVAAVIGCGFLGARIALELASQQVEVRVYDRSSSASEVCSSGIVLGG